MAKKGKKHINKILYLLIFCLTVVAVSIGLKTGKLIFNNNAAFKPECFRYPCPTSSTKTAGTVAMGFMGDLSIGRYVNKRAYDSKSFDLFDSKMESFLKSNFLNVANFESSIIGRNAQGVLQCPISGSGGLMILCGLPDFVPELSRNNFIFTLANNHINDFSSINGKERTMGELDKYHIPYYYSHDLKTEFIVKEKNNIKFGFLGIDLVQHMSFNQTSFDRIIKLINKYDRQVDWLILSLHWGQEYVSKPSKTQVEYAHAFIDAGADIIHGHHPHVLQPYERYKNKFIFYSLGNFVFDQDFQESTRTSSVYRVTFTKDLINKVTEYKISIPKDGRTKLSSPETIYDKTDRPRLQ